MSLFEAIMLACFGFAWPANILKSLKARSSKGKSFSFLLIIGIGYVSGITHKLLYSRDIVLVLYVFNLVMVSIDIALYFRNMRLDKLRDKAGV